ncbi:hypothetical protein SynA1544_02772 [Synechococcus sp. A15-44]|nr:hypothetical protein SynA1544_02772 [Synechococcus sp. A15-44]
MHLAGTQHSSEPQSIYPAAKAAAPLKYHACNSPTRQNEQPEHKPPAPQQQSGKQNGVRTTSGFNNPC